MADQRWTILRKLGEGGSGSVFLARSPSGETSAVKVMSSGVEGKLLEGEAEMLMRLKHLGLAGIRGYLKDSSEIFGENRGPCFWMEFVDGPDVVSAARASQDPTEAALRWFGQALGALEYLHRQNVIHGDLTPQNLRIGADGNLKIIDFGFASIGRAEIPADGTLLYMAPERFQSIKDEAGDLFSLGTVFYEALAGVHPRAGCRSLTEMFRIPPKPLAETCPGMSRFPVAARVIDALISPKVVDRFGSAEEALRALRSDKPEQKRKTDAYYSRIFYGAEPALRSVDEALASLGGKAAFFAVHGNTGVGRTRFLNEVAFRGALEGNRVVDVSPENFSRTLLRRREEGAAPTIFLFRALENVPRSELSQLLTLHRDPSRKDLMIFEWNDDALDAESRRLLLHSPLAVRWTDVVLKNFDASQTKDFLAGALGASIADEVAVDLFAATQGRPRLLSDWAVFFREKGWTDKAHFSRDWLASAEGPWSLEALLEARWRGLDPLEKNLVETLAVDGGRAPLEELLETVRSKVSAEDENFAWSAVGALDGLREKGLIAVDADAAGHAVYRVALEPLIRLAKREIEAGRLKEIHRAWLEALRNVPDENFRKIRHLIALKEKEKFVPALEAVSVALRRAERHREALQLVEEAFESFDGKADAVSRSRLLRLKTNLLNETGRYREALACCEENLKLAAPDEPLSLKRAKYWIVTGLIFENLGDLPEALRRFESCREAAASLEGDERTSYLTRAHTLIGRQLFAQGETALAVESFENALKLAPAEGRERAETCRNLAVARAREGRWPEAGALLEEAGVLYRRDGFVSGEFAARLLKGNLDLGRDDPKSATQAYEEAEAVAASHRNDILLARVWNNQGVLARTQGDLARSWERGQRALEIFRALGNSADLSESLKQNVLIKAQLGRFAEADSLLSELRAMADSDGRWKPKLEEAERQLALLRDGSGLAVGVDDPTILGQRLERIRAALPKELQVSFVDRADYRKWVLNKDN